MYLDFHLRLVLRDSEVLEVLSGVQLHSAYVRWHLVVSAPIGVTENSYYVREYSAVP